MNLIFKFALILTSLSLAACSSVDSVLMGDKVDYKSASKSKAPELVVPPDLNQMQRDPRYVIPGSTVTASGYQQATQANAGMATAVKSVADVRIERSGSQRWLVVDRPAEQLWSTIKDFWLENGFTLTIDQAQIGIMETEWAENRAKIPQDGIRRLLGKVLDGLYDSGLRDKYRTRLERNASGGTEIFITHRGMSEEYIDPSRRQQTRWEPRASDPELETEFLRRLMVKLGVAKEVADKQGAPEAPRVNARVVTLDGLPVVQLEDGFDRAWRRVGLALDRTGFTVEDRDRSQGVFYVRYVEPAKKEEESNFFKRMFSSKAKDSAPRKFRITVKGQASTSTVAVLDADGRAETSEVAQGIVKLLADELK